MDAILGRTTLLVKLRIERDLQLHLVEPHGYEVVFTLQKLRTAL